MQNSNIGMTKDQYFEMCEMLGSEPKESEIPIEFEDFPIEMQQAFSAYKMLRDEWDGFNGVYLGKSLIGIGEVLTATEIDPEDQEQIDRPDGPSVDQMASSAADDFTSDLSK